MKNPKIKKGDTNMEQNYYYDQGTIYEFDSLACKEVIKDYLKRNNKTRL